MSSQRERHPIDADGRLIGPWFFAESLKPGSLVLSEQESQHAVGSRRLHPNDPLTLFDGRGGLAQACIVGADKRARKIEVRVETIVRHDPPAPTLTLVTAAPKGPRQSTLVEKCTELGADRIVFATFERSIAQISETARSKLARTAIEACKQSRRPFVPTVETTNSIDEALAARSASGRDRRYIADPQSDAPSLAAALCEPSDADVCVLVGPEGGFSEDERARITALGVRCVQLGPHILRIETAAIAVTAIWAAQRPRADGIAT